MYKISIWLIGGGKIVEECDIDYETVKEIYNKIMNTVTSSNEAVIPRNDEDNFPIVVRKDQIAAIQIDERATASASDDGIICEGLTSRRGTRRLDTSASNWKR